MISERNFIFFGEDWGRFPSTTQHIAKVLLEQNRILWVGSLGHRKPTLSLRDLKRTLEKIKKFFSSKKNDGKKGKPLLLHPFIIPYHDNNIISRMNNILLYLQVSRAQKKYNFSNPIIISSTPIVNALLGKLNETIAVYLCLDDYSSFEGAFESLAMMESKMLNKVSIAFYVSKILRESKTQASGKSYLLPQGVDTKHFRKNKEKDNLELRQLEHPIIGFFGLISEWFDIELYIRAAQKLSDFTFLLIGKTTIDISVMNSAPNIKFIGEINYEKLPLYAKTFDVGLIPFKVNKLTYACNPLKLMEYLSLEIPVVAADLPEIRKFKDHIFIYQSELDFIQKITSAVKDSDASKKLERRAVAESYSWNAITEYVCEKILDRENSLSIFEKPLDG